MYGKLLDSKKLVEGYLLEEDWRVKENSNSPKSFGALNKYISSEVSKNFWINHVYDEEIKKAYLEGDIHIHDLGNLTIYCCGYSLENILLMGVQGVSNIPTSKPPSHFASALNQLANLITVLQNEQSGAVALNNVDTLLSPFIAHDGLTKKQVKQDLQNFIFSINSNSRGGAEPAFTNITLDITPPKDMLEKNAIIGGKYIDKKLKEFQKEMDIFNDVFADLMLEGDSKGVPFSYPIITYNIGKRFDWDNPNTDKIFEMAGKFGYPYFSNYINSDLEEGDLRSMCCRLRLSITELRKRNGGLFGSGDSTGSIGVVTVNLPRIGFVSNNKEELFSNLDKMLILSKRSLEMKREYLQKNVLDGGLIPAFNTYVGTLNNHFSTIGIIGMNELCENFLGEDILSENGHSLALEIGEFIRNKLIQFQIETGKLYNYESSPAESTCYRLAKKDLSKFPDIITQGTKTSPYYTNSTHIPVKKITSIKQVSDHQDDLQQQYTGGCVTHYYLNGAISGKQAKHIIKTVLTNYKVPYITLSPLNRYCPEHGYIIDKVENCPICGKELDLYIRITGYMRKVDNFNIGKKQEFKERVLLDGNKGF